MPVFDQEKIAAAIELQHLIMEWGADLDSHGGRNLTRLLTEDCNYLIGAKAYRGHAEVQAYYDSRVEVIRAQFENGRTQRHAISNLRFDFKSADKASVAFMLVNYSGAGQPPVRNLVGPTIVADCRMEFAKGTDGNWLIAMFDSAPIFVGNDPYLNAAVVKK